MMRFDIRGMVKYTVQNVAALAVMAGAKPEYFPVILATAATSWMPSRSSTPNWSAMLLVNGPIRNEIGMNCRHRRIVAGQHGELGHRPGLDTDVHLLGGYPAEARTCGRRWGAA